MHTEIWIRIILGGVIPTLGQEEEKQGQLPIVACIACYAAIGSGRSGVAEMCMHKQEKGSDCFLGIMRMSFMQQGK